jgi:hypothetical protein
MAALAVEFPLQRSATMTLSLVSHHSWHVSGTYRIACISAVPAGACLL